MYVGSVNSGASSPAFRWNATQTTPKALRVVRSQAEGAVYVVPRVMILETVLLVEL